MYFSALWSVGTKKKELEEKEFLPRDTKKTKDRHLTDHNSCN